MSEEDKLCEARYTGRRTPRGQNTSGAQRKKFREKFQKIENFQKVYFGPKGVKIRYFISKSS